MDRGDRIRREDRGASHTGRPPGGPSRPPLGVEAFLALQRSAGNRAAASLQRYYYRQNTHEPVDEAIRYADDYDPATAPNLRPDTELNLFKRQNRKDTFFYLDGQTGSPMQHAYVKGLLSESRKVIAKGQEILDQLERDMPPETAPFMLGVLETEEEIRVTHSGQEVKEGFEAVLASLQQVGEKALRYVRESPERGHEHGPHRLTCAAPKLLATVDAATLLPAMTEIWFDRAGQGVVVDGIRYHHGQRVPSCPSCEHNLRLLVFKQMRKQVTDALRVAQPEAEPTASTDITLDRFRNVSKEYLKQFRIAAELLRPVGKPADAQQTRPAADTMAKLLETVERQVGTPQSDASLRAALRGLAQDAQAAVVRHEQGVMEGDPGLTDYTAHGSFTAKWASETYPQIRNALKKAVASL